MALSPEAAAIVAQLELKPHPEGGHYRETFRDLSVDADGRSRSTAIYFLLARGERSHWHRIDAAETWHYYAGSALTLRIADDKGRRIVKLGADLAAGENQRRRRQQRRRVGRGAQHADVAALHADVPNEERGPHGANAERDDGKPLPDRLRPGSGLDHAMDQRGQHRGREAEARHRI